VSNLDEALERFHIADLEYAGGRANHGPMAAEALESLGHQALIPALLDLYVPRLPPAEKGRVLAGEDLVSARGRPERRADWVATFEARLEREEDWRTFVGGVVPDLLPGLFASAGHGLLRTAHAVRGLEREDSPLRRRELARGLASWAAREQTLPGRPGVRATAEGRSRGLEAFFEALPRSGGGRGAGAAGSAGGDELFIEAARRLESDADFRAAIEAAPTPEDGADLEAWLVELARVGAGLYLAHPGARIAYVHAVTLPVALRELVPLLGAESARAGAGYVLQALAALHALFDERGGQEEGAGAGEVAWGVVGAPAAAALDPSTESWDEIRYRAACSIQEHAIKLAEACWRLHAVTPDRVFRRAAADAALRLEGSRSAGGC
jgi:hypothetical protein